MAEGKEHGDTVRYREARHEKTKSNPPSAEPCSPSLATDKISYSSRIMQMVCKIAEEHRDFEACGMWRPLGQRSSMDPLDLRSVNGTVSG